MNNTLMPKYNLKKKKKRRLLHLIYCYVRGQHLWIFLSNTLIKNRGEKIQDFLFLIKDTCLTKHTC